MGDGPDPDVRKQGHIHDKRGYAPLAFAREQRVSTKMLMKTIVSVLLATLVFTISTANVDAAPRDHRVAKAGHQLRVLPQTHQRIVHRGKSYFFTNGRFYRENKGMYVSITAPLGAIVPALPSGFLTFGIGSNRYYYHQGVYYRRGATGYVVIKEPAQAESSLAAGSDRLIIYPAAGQSIAQKNRDKFECHEWAFDETGFDPTDVDSDPLRRGDYQRAMGACLEARDYVVR